MGAYTTLVVSKRAALAKVMWELSRDELTCRDLSSILFDVVGEKLLYNFHVIDGPAGRDDEFVMSLEPDREVTLCEGGEVLR